MAKRTVRTMDFPALVEVNRQVVLLTGEPHEFLPADRQKLEGLLSEVEVRADTQDPEEAVTEKASLLVFKLASGQYFRAGNKRTALVAGLSFLRKNGWKIEIKDPEFVSLVDRAGVGAATLDDLYSAMSRLITKGPTERKGWEGAVKTAIESNRKFLTDLAT